jgi:hypothetical protein
MNPDARLQYIRAAIADLRSHGGGAGDKIAKITAAFEALDRWLCEGGTKPRDWQEAHL